MATAQSLTEGVEARGTSGPASSAVVFDEPAPSVVRTVREGWANRHIVGWLAGRMLVKQYTKTKLGRTWVAARPLIDGGARTVLFGGVLSIATPNDVPYFLFLMVGMMAWMTFEQTVYWGVRSLDRYLKLVRRLNFPLVLVPIAGGVQGVVFLASYLAILAVAIGYYAIVKGTMYLVLGPQLLLGALGIVLALLFAWGVNFWFSVLDARFYDVRNTMRYVLPVGLYLTPVVYPISQLGSPWKTIAVANPVAPIVEMTKYGFIGAADVSPLSVLWAAAATAITLVSGLWFFSRQAGKSLGLYDDGDDEDEELT